jgi:cadmium resistance protein CadD (predicted permease)
MGHLLSVAGLAVVAFVATNIDDLLLLVALFADPRFTASQILLGQFIGMAALIALSLAGALLAIIVPAGWLGLLGLVPLSLGVLQLVRRDRGASALPTPPAASSSQLVLIALVTVANGGDNLSLYIPLFSVHPPSEIAIFTGIFLLLTALWCAIAHALARRHRGALALSRWGGRALPYIMIGLGLYILAKADAQSILPAMLAAPS